MDFIPYLMLLFIKIVIILSVLIVQTVETGIKSELIDVVGPGLRPDLIVMPARYFFIYWFGKGENRNYSLSNEEAKVDITGRSVKTDKECRLWINILDRKDGSYIVRYKLYETCYDVEISVRYNGKHVGGSPFRTKWVVQPEECYCPLSQEKWLQLNHCPKYYTQIKADLKAFPTVNFSSFHSDIVKKVDNSGSMSLCNYVILNNEIYRRCYGQHTGFKMFPDAMLTSLARKMQLPDMELFINLGDWPLSLINSVEAFPIFSWCGSDSTLDIVMPTYDITESTLETMGRVSLDMLSIQGNVDLPWADREAKVFWRGRDSNRARLKLIDIGRKNPDLFNVSLTNFFFFRDQEHIYGPKAQHSSFFKFFDYRYQINMDGTVAAYRMPYLLAGGSLVFKQESEYYEHFYHQLKPYEHYVPVKRDLSDLVEKVRWARDNDEEAHKIAQAGQQFARSNLLGEHIFCYHAVLFKEWSTRLQEPVFVRNGMEKVEQPKTDYCDCNTAMEEVLSHDEL